MGLGTRKGRVGTNLFRGEKVGGGQWPTEKWGGTLQEICSGKTRKRKGDGAVARATTLSSAGRRGKKEKEQTTGQGVMGVEKKSRREQKKGASTDVHQSDTFEKKEKTAQGERGGPKTGGEVRLPGRGAFPCEKG